MAENNQDTGRAAGPWDVVMHLANRFPAFVLLGLAVAGLFYFVNQVLDQRNDAIEAADIARQQIAKEQSDSREKIDAAEARAADKEAEADKRIREADKRQSEARSNALLEVNQFLLDTSSKVQVLVAGQLNSMVELEQIRKLSAGELQAQIVALEEQRQKTQRELETVKLKLRVSRVEFALDGLERALTENQYESGDAIKVLLETFETGDVAAVQAIEERLSQRSSPNLNAAVSYGMAFKTGEDKWVNSFLNTLGRNPRSLEPNWVSAMLGCCVLPEAFWIGAYPAITRLVVDENLDIELRQSFFRFFERRKDYFGNALLSDSQIADNEISWQLLSLAIKYIKEKRVDTPKGISAYSVLSLLEAFEPAAAHVWSELLAEEGEGERTRAAAESYLQDIEGYYESTSGGPTPSISDFWRSDDLIAIRREYPSQGTSGDYRGN